MKRKSFRYHTNLSRVADRAGMLGSGDKPVLRVASPPEFKGEEGAWTPEDLFVAALETCMLTTFAAFSLRLGLPVVSYESTAEGLLEFDDGGYRFTRVWIRPVVVVESEEAVAQAGETLHDAHAKCLIANSVRTDVVLEPRVNVRG